MTDGAAPAVRGRIVRSQRARLADSPAELRAFLGAPRNSCGEPLYLDLPSAPVFATLHSPQGPSRQAVGVLACPAFGWDELCSHRTVRAFADLCARSGFSALRLDLPGTGDSAGEPSDPGLFDSWLEALDAGARVLREREGARRVVALGIGLGALLACRLAADGGPLDDLLLWSAPATGAALVREIRAFGRLAAVAGSEVAARDALLEGSIQAAGFVLGAETVAALEQTDLTTLTLAQAARRRVMLLGRDRPPDERLRASFEGAGVEVTVADGDGYTTMMLDPLESVMPCDTLSLMLGWLEGAPPEPAVPVAPAEGGQTVGVRSEVILRGEGGGMIREAPCELQHGALRLSGVLCEPVSAPRTGIGTVLLNAGATRRIGPHRMMVENARRWAAVGVATLRLDMATIGDSDGVERTWHPHEFYDDDFIAQTRVAIDALEQRGLSTFALCGLCSGAYWSLRAGLADERVRALLLLNPSALYWTEAVASARDLGRARTLLREGDLRELTRMLISERWRIARLVRTMIRDLALLGRGRGVPRRSREIASAFERLQARGVDVTLLVGSGETTYGDLVDGGLIDRGDSWPSVHIEQMWTRDHTFIPPGEQRHVAERIDRAIMGLLGVAEAEGAGR